ncbi:MAG: acetyl-CoA hydrolase/transferase family protein [Christensenellales bacterium]|jgi:4-hydroxybutyrate CoA-transferase
MTWKEYYSKRSITAEEAVRHIKSGDRVVISHATAEPIILLNAMANRKYHIKDVETVHMVGMGESLYARQDMQGTFRHTSLFVGGPERGAIYEGRADFIPVYFSNIPGLFLDDYLPVDVALLTVSPPDKHGYVSLGISVDYGVAAVKKGKTVIAQVNRYCPRTHGESFVHVSEIDYFVEHDAPLIPLAPGAITPVEETIGSYCASLVEDGATLQLGIGSLPDAVLKFLTDKNDLWVHSEMISDGVMNLMLSGNINNRVKTLHTNKTVVTFLMGTQELYDFVDDNPSFYLAPANYTNDPCVIAQNDNMVSINSCVEVDLMGQVNAESIGLKQISGVGGQVDFVRGANMSKGGKAIIAMPSTAKGGKASRIVPFLQQGAAVTTSRCDVGYIVTEYGIADLRNVTLRERAKRLIRIAHPSFKETLAEEFEKRFCMPYLEQN